MGKASRRKRDRDVPAEIGAAPPKPPWRGWTIAVLLVVAAAAALYWFWPFTGAPVSASYVGGQACAGCHETEAKAWKPSHHSLAMQVAEANTVLGNFNDATFTYGGITTTFFRRDGKFGVRTDGPDGKLHDYIVAYTFGVTPLQQYLIAFPGGRLQALSIAWDTRPKAQGGQRWFHLYPGERITHKDELHWTGLQQNWNYMCADCHVTDLRKNFDAATASYKTAWSEPNVSCEACHGPGSRHIEWAKSLWPGAGGGNKGLSVRLDARRGVHWKIDPASGNATRSTPKKGDAEIEVCAQCHARRGQLADGYTPGKPFHDYYLPALLTPSLYHADGQQRDEVYNWGSFLQSKMYARGVTCGDCHDPHSGKLRADGNVVCAQCHLPDKYNTAAHHRHPNGTAGAQCVACHMPTATYMVVDPRHDHSFRIPRPDLSVTLGTPNACNQCHSGKDAQWAKSAFEKWWGTKTLSKPHYGEVLHAARQGRTQTAGLIGLIKDKNRPAIVRATALEMLAQYHTPETVQVGIDNMDDADALVRRAALRCFEFLAPAQRYKAGMSLLTDKVRSVRIEAGRSLASAVRTNLPAEERKTLDRVVAEYLDAQRFNNDRPESFMNMGLLYLDLGEPAKAESLYNDALARHPRFAPVYVNLADLYRQQGDETLTEQVLRTGLANVTDGADLRHALGLLLVRKKRYDEALIELGRASRERPESARYAYVYGVALHSTGKVNDAVRTLEAAQRRHPTDRAILEALIGMHGENGNAEKARAYTGMLQAL